jgi:hypothetical protein
MGLDLLDDRNLRARAKAAFLSATGSAPYSPGIPVEQHLPPRITLTYPNQPAAVATHECQGIPLDCHHMHS